MNKNLAAILLACSAGVGTYLLAGPSGAQEGPPQEDTTCVSDPDCSAEHPTSTEVVCDPVPNSPDCENYEDYWHGTETSVFVCSPHPDPACFEGSPGKSGEAPRRVPEVLAESPAATAPPAQAKTPWTLPHTT